MKEKFSNVLNFCWAFFIVALLLSLIGLFFYGLELEGRQNVVQELCTRQQYDFCEVARIEYKLKEIVDD